MRGSGSSTGAGLSHQLRARTRHDHRSPCESYYSSCARTIFRRARHATIDVSMAAQWKYISGATSQDYTIASATLLTMGAMFRAVVSNNSGASLFSNQAMLTVSANQLLSGITQPSGNLSNSGGMVINFAGTVIHPEDGNLSGSLIHVASRFRRLHRHSSFDCADDGRDWCAVDHSHNRWQRWRQCGSH